MRWRCLLCSAQECSWTNALFHLPLKPHMHRKMTWCKMWSRSWHWIQGCSFLCHGSLVVSWVNKPSEPSVHFPGVRLFHIWWHIGSYFCAEAGDYAPRTDRRIVWYLIRFPIPWVPLHDFCLYDPNWQLLIAWDNFGFSLESCTFLDPDSLIIFFYFQQNFTCHSQNLSTTIYITK